MAWRAAAGILSFAVLFLSVTRSIASFARNPLRVLGAAVIAGILSVTLIGAFSLTLTAAETFASFAGSVDGSQDRRS